MFRRAAGLAVGALLAFAPSAVAGGVPDLLYGLTTDSPPHLVSFAGASPGSLASDITISGLDSGEDIVVGMDASPRDGGLYVLAKRPNNAGKLYSLDPATGVLTAIGTLAPSAGDPYTQLQDVAY